MTLRMPRAALAALTLTVTLTACTSVAYTETPVPTPGMSAAGPPTGVATAAPSTPAPASQCSPAPAGFQATQSYAPLAALPATAQLTGRLGEIRDRGYLIAGVSADTLLLGARNPLTGQIEGFDIDVVGEIARAIFNDPNRVQLVVINAAGRQSALTNRTVDVVARNMTMTCARWLDWPIAFSAEYYRSGQKVLVRKGQEDATKSLADLAKAKARVCAPAGTTSMTKLREFEAQGIVPVEADTHTGCLVRFQQGSVAAITGDDTVLAGLVAQDPYGVVPPQDAVTAEPYGLGFNAADKVFVQYVNRVLETVKADGRWTAIYNRWLAASLGPAPSPPPAAYGRA